MYLTLVSVTLYSSIALRSLGMCHMQISTRMKSTNKSILRFIQYVLLYRVKSSTLTLTPPLTHIHGHEKLLPLHARNNTSINNTDKNEKNYIETRQKQCRSKALFYNWWSVKNHSSKEPLIQGSDSDITFEKWAEKVCFHLCLVHKTTVSELHHLAQEGPAL